MKSSKQSVLIIKRLLPVLAVVLAAVIVGYLFGRGGASPAAPEDHETHSQAEAETQVWTCSMHPQIRSFKPGLCPICNMELVPVSSGGDAHGLRQLTVSEDAKKLMDVQVMPVERRFVDAVVRMVGKVDYDETRLAYIAAWVPGRLDRLYVDYTGVPVKEGDHMAYLYSPELISAQEELLQAIEAGRNVQDTELGVMRDMSEGLVKAAREKLRLWGLKPEQIQEIEQTGKVQDHMTIYAPTSGIVIHKNALQGMYVQTGTQIYTIADLSQVWVKLNAYESDLGWLRYGQEVEFTTVSYPGEVFKGSISFIDPILDERTRSVKVRVNVPNPDGKLKPSMFVKAVVHSTVAAGGRIMSAELRGKWMCPMHPEVVADAPGECSICEMPLVRTESLGYVGDDPALVQKPLVIPASAALVTGTRAIVYVQLPDTEKPTFEGREIVLGPRAGDHYLVRSGLKEGELVVVKGNFKIDSSLQIMAKPSMMTPEGAGGGAMHDHGGQTSGSGDMTDTASELPALARYQIKAVIKAARQVRQAVDGQNIAEIRSAFSVLDKAIKAVDMTQLTGHPHMVWMEMAMRLTNDAVEGVDARTLEVAQRVARGLEENIDSLAGKLGVTAEAVTESRPLISEDFRTQLDTVFARYVDIQNALADDEVDAAVKGAVEMAKALGLVDMTLLDGDDHQSWMKMKGEIETTLTRLAEGKDIKALRESFYLLSQNIIKVAREFGSTSAEPLYVMYCPMAFDNKGATWLQDRKDLRNPYFGEMMLQCGEVKEVVAAKDIWK